MFNGVTQLNMYYPFGPMNHQTQAIISINVILTAENLFTQ